MDTPQQTPPPVPNTTPVTPTPAPYTPPPVKPAPVPFVPPVASSPAPMAMPPQGGSHTGMLLTIFVVLLILAAAAYYFFYRTAGEPTESPSPSVTMSPIVTEETPTPSPSSMASVSWQVYSNEQYGFEISTPPSWASRVVTTTIPTGKTADVQIAYSPTAQLPAQSVEILVYTSAQWDAELMLNQPHPNKIGQSTVYVYATPVRLDTSGLPGEADIPGIITTFKLR